MVIAFASDFVMKMNRDPYPKVPDSVCDGTHRWNRLEAAWSYFDARHCRVSN